ncbi:Cytochrome P450 CYP94D108-like protein [Drosera capensis]
MTANPLNVEHMLKTNFSNYPKGARFSTILHDFLGVGIFNTDDDLWRFQRKTASFEFNNRSMRVFVSDTVRTEIQTRLIPFLERKAASGQVFDLQDVLERFAFDNVCKIAFNVDPGYLGWEDDCWSGMDGDGFMRAFEETTTLSSDRFMYVVRNFWSIKKLFSVGSEKRLSKAIKTVHEFVDEIIRQRLEEKSRNYEDLLTRFIESTTEGASPEFLRDVVISFILAGRDTTSSGLSWFFWLLSSHPKAIDNIRAEVQDFRARRGKPGDDPPVLDELRDMNYLHGAISEALRLYPPVSLDSRSCTRDDVLPDGTFIKKDWFIAYNSYAMGRMESIWGKDCEAFRPERWLENRVFKQESPFRYPVFHAGPRICLGREMAYIQMKSIAACVLERFEVDVVEKEKKPDYFLSLTVRIKGGLPVGVVERNR